MNTPPPRSFPSLSAVRNDQSQNRLLLHSEPHSRNAPHKRARPSLAWIYGMCGRRRTNPLYGRGDDEPGEEFYPSMDIFHPTKLRPFYCIPSRIAVQSRSISSLELSRVTFRVPPLSDVETTNFRRRPLRITSCVYGLPHGMVASTRYDPIALIDDPAAAGRERLSTRAPPRNG